MHDLAQATIEEKLNDLCAAIVADAEVAEARVQAEAFLADEAAVGFYRRLAQTENELHHKQHAGQRIPDAEMAAFVALRREAEEHAAVRSFTEAQEVLQGIANLVNGFVTKTLEKGRIPSHDEVFPKQGGCGSGCGCH